MGDKIMRADKCGTLFGVSPNISLYRATLAKADGNINSMHAVLVQATRGTIDKFKNHLFEGR